MTHTDVIVGKWDPMRGRIKERWGRIADFDLDRAPARHAGLVGLVQEKYGYTREEAEQEVSRFVEKMNGYGGLRRASSAAKPHVVSR
ncbi:MAG: CsbD family protein [Chloroflexi bacterium]|nr:CsbD family protein [Chloroflexota bacterium]